MATERDDDGGVELGYYAVCLLDILGQADRLNGWQKLPEPGTKDEAFLGAVRNTIGTVRAFRRSFCSYFAAVGESTMPDRVQKLSHEHQQTYRRLRDCELKSQQFSDTFVFYSLLKNSAGDVPVSGVFRLLGACCMGMILSFAAGKPIRGALCIGAGAELGLGNFYGPALADAYRCESKIAGYPRVVVSDAVRELVAQGQRFSDAAIVNTMMQDLAGVARSLIVKDTDGRWIVDFLGEGAIDAFCDCPTTKQAVAAGYEFVRREFCRFRDSVHPVLMERYRQLLAYFEGRIHLWGITQQPV